MKSKKRNHSGINFSCDKAKEVVDEGIILSERNFAVGLQSSLMSDKAIAALAIQLETSQHNDLARRNRVPSQVSDMFSGNDDEDEKADESEEFEKKYNEKSNNLSAGIIKEQKSIRSKNQNIFKRSNGSTAKRQPRWQQQS